MQENDPYSTYIVEDLLQVYHFTNLVYIRMEKYK